MSALEAFRRPVIRGFLAAAACLSAVSTPGAAERGGPKLPAPGSYVLDHIQRVPSGIVLESGYLPRLLSSYATGSVTLLALFYGHCKDPEGCPLAWNAFEKIREASRSDAALRTGVRLVFLSFDPAHDTPEALQAFARNYAGDGQTTPWHFLTTYSAFFLTPILEGLGQEIASASPSAGSEDPAINHLLKVFLIDRDGWVREIYTSAFLDPPALVNDMKTLLMEKRPD